MIFSLGFCHKKTQVLKEFEHMMEECQSSFEMDYIVPVLVQDANAVRNPPEINTSSREGGDGTGLFGRTPSSPLYIPSIEGLYPPYLN